MKSVALIAILCVSTTGCATERLYVHVDDELGRPVANAVVELGTMNKVIPFGSDRAKDYDHYEAVTDTNGNAVVKFNCKNGCFGWGVNASNYYPSVSHRAEFKGDYLFPMPMCVLYEHEKRASEVIWRKRNPQPMYARGGFPSIRPPCQNGRFGFDMKVFDWLPPQGKGEVADFYLVQNIGKIKHGTKYAGYIEFEDGCGAYLAHKTGNKIFPSTYSADTNATFISRFDFVEVGQKDGEPIVRRKYIAQENEYMVLRTRVKRDLKGNVISANYSKLLGPVGVGYVLEFSELVFNHRPNDPNLELDSRNNMVEEYRSHGLAP